MDSPNHQQNDEDLSSPHPAKRRLMDGALDYPRRRATIAVSPDSLLFTVDVAADVTIFIV